jgi:CubicO group peptidase (beta-lactamase class C family)
MIFSIKTINSLRRYAFVTLVLFMLQTCRKDNGSDSESIYFPAPGSDIWETVSPSSLGWNESEIPALKDLLRNNGTRAFILLKNGKIVIEEYFGNNLAGTSAFNRNTIWYWASAGKTLTAFTVGKAQEDGFLKILNNTSDYLGAGWTSLTSLQESKITVRHQLTMTTGLDDNVTDNHSFLPQDLKYKSDAGTRWAYHNGPYTLLEKVIKNAVNEEFESYFNHVLRDMTGMDGTWIWTGNDHVFYSSARSMSRFGLLILNGGNWAENVIMRDGDYFKNMINTSQSINKSYGYLWWLNGKESYMVPESQLLFPGSLTPNAPVDMISGIGKNGQYVSVVPSMGIVMVRMGEDPSSVPVPFLFLNDIWGKLKLIIR